MKTIHSKKMFRDDLQYARQMIRRIEKAIANDDWETIVEEANELEPLFSALRCNAIDNREGILDFGCKYPDEIAEIRAEQEAERKRKEQKELAAWQKAGEKVAREFEQALGVKITVVTEGLETK